jgi:parallel beta-helix repeat protein
MNNSSSEALMKTLFVVITLVLAFAVNAAAAEPLFYDKAFITKDTTWSGTILLRGQNVVKKGCTLTILPGTVVKFLWSDEDGDNIGDGELTVEGLLIAKGTKDNFITFTSGQPNPKMKDWTFVQISVNKGAEVEYCKFEYGFSGLQVHYSTATIKNSLFQYNFEGIRFSTTDVLIENNDITKNYYGIRCEAHGSRTTLRKNRFWDNEHAFFPVQKTWDSVKIYDNNIEGSRNYNVNFGTNQKRDMDFTNNWWATTDGAAIEATIFDKTKDDSLGRVKYIPFLKEPVKDCGIL